MKVEREPFAGCLSVLIIVDPLYWALECVLKCNGIHVGALKPEVRNRLVFVETGERTTEEAIQYLHAHVAEIRREAMAEMLRPAVLN